LKDGADVRRFCEVQVKDGEVYIFQPRKRQSVKVSYHKSGRMHVKSGVGGTIMQPMHLALNKRDKTGKRVLSS
jgi:hypothetical protein